MCLIIEKGYELQVATKDIEVYKIFNQNFDGSLRTPFMYILYKLGEKAVSKIKKEFDETNYFDTKEANDYGYFPEKYYKIARLNFDVHLKLNNLTVIQYGIHSIKTLTRAKMIVYDEKKIVKCIIPKGSRYIFNKSDLCVSDELIPIEIYKPKK